MTALINQVSDESSILKDSDDRMWTAVYVVLFDIVE